MKRTGYEQSTHTVLQPRQLGDDGLLVGNNLILSTLDLYDFFNDLPYLIIKSLYLIIESLYLVIESLYLTIESLYLVIEPLYLVIEPLYPIIESLYLIVKSLYIAIESLYIAIESPYIATKSPYNLLDCLYILTDFSILQVDASKHGNNHGERCKNIFYVHDSFLPDDRCHVTSMPVTRPSFRSILASRVTGRAP